MKYIFFILTWLSISSVFSQHIQNDSSANYTAYWSKGESKTYYISHNKINYESLKVKSEFKFSYEANVVILDSTKNNYTIQWTFHLPKKVKEANPKLADSLPVYEGMKMIFKTTEMGEFKELMNWEEVKNAYIKMMEFSLPKIMDSTTKLIYEKSKALFNTKEIVESALIKEIRLFYLPYGYTYTTKEISTKVQLPNPFASDPLPALETIKMTELNPINDYLILVIKQKIDKLNAQKFFEDFFKKVDMSNDKAIMEATKFIENFEINDDSEYKFMPSKGWTKSINYTRTTKNGKMSQTDSYLIQMKE